VIGVSTGGPQALRYLLARLPASISAALAIVLHMPPGYTGPLAAHLDELSGLEVLEAEEGLEMRPGRAILARAGYHLSLVLSAGEEVVSHLDLSPQDTPHRPAVDVLFRSAAEIYHERTLGVVLTGMGNDGTAGSVWIKAAGGQVLTEAEETCVVYGMPRSVVEAGLSDRMVSIHHLPEIILRMVQ
jgi:two-component system chemotaxis response regulator CheB